MRLETLNQYRRTRIGQTIREYPASIWEEYSVHGNLPSVDVCYLEGKLAGEQIEGGVRSSAERFAYLART